MKTVLTEAVVYTPERGFDDGELHVDERGTISYLGPRNAAPPCDGPVRSLCGKSVIPGLLDIHLHGGNGISFGMGDNLRQDLLEYAKWVPASGVTGFLISIAPPDHGSYLRIIDCYASILDEGVSGAQPMGLHLEGPFLSVEKRATFDPDWLRLPDLKQAREMIEAGRGWIRQITMAPELPGAFKVAELFRETGIVVALGHSNADYETARRALDGGWTAVTHTYNAMSGLHHREPGVVGAVLTSGSVYAELIADGIHVHPAAIRVLVNSIGVDQVVLTTDGMEAAGLADGVYDVLGHRATVRDGACRLDSGILAGSSALLNNCVYTVVVLAGVDLADAVQMATLNPARSMGLTASQGFLAEGRPATLTVVDNKMQVELTMVNGRIVYDRKVNDPVLE